MASSKLWSCSSAKVLKKINACLDEDKTKQRMNKELKDHIKKYDTGDIDTAVRDKARIFCDILKENIRNSVSANLYDSLGGDRCTEIGRHVHPEPGKDNLEFRIDVRITGGGNGVVRKSLIPEKYGEINLVDLYDQGVSGDGGKSSSGGKTNDGATHVMGSITGTWETHQGDTLEGVRNKRKIEGANFIEKTMEQFLDMDESHVAVYYHGEIF